MIVILYLYFCLYFNIKLKIMNAILVLTVISYVIYIIIICSILALIIMKRYRKIGIFAISIRSALLLPDYKESIRSSEYVLSHKIEYHHEYTIIKVQYFQCNEDHIVKLLTNISL